MLPRLNFSMCAYLVTVLICLSSKLTSSQLIINVKNQGGDVVQENISANVTDDTVTLEFQRSDGTLVTQLIDFRNEVQVIKALILGEEERGQSQYQVVCFLFHFPKDSFISSDAMSKLRQKNPSAIRIPEQDLVRDNYTMDYHVSLQHSGVFSPHIADLCAEAKESTYVRHEDLTFWSINQGIPVTTFLKALIKLPRTKYRSTKKDVEDKPKANVETCTGSKVMWSPCYCHLEICIGWYPCSLKYCKGKGQTKNSYVTYRCGIKTCRKCHLFTYYVEEKEQCMWDE
ncbi:out at first protein [Coccinella septempunctata]|uniref:out at first protein n=1 Tax=Coccinella septempunctata TaxID=41139 RepID=UPI001D065365|nr:out at first protein [Coccinella septempunctata]